MFIKPQGALQIAFEDRLTEVITIMFSLAASYSVYEGASAFVNGVLHQLLMALASFGVEVGVYLYFHRAYPRASFETRRQLRIWLYAALPFIFCLSTLMGVVFFSGDSAIRNHMAGVVDTAEVEATTLFKHLKREGEMQPQLAAFQGQFGKMAGIEKSGGFTGAAGPGSTAATLESISRMFGEMASIVTTNQKQTDRTYIEVQAALNEMRTMAYKASGHRKMVEEFAKQVSAYNIAIARLQATSSRAIIDRLSERLTQVAAISAVTGSVNAAVATRQQAATAEIRQSTEGAQRSVQELIGNQQIRDMKPLSYSSMDIFKAVFTYGDHNLIIGLMFALALDFCPLLFLFMKTIVAQDKDKGTTSSM